MASKYDSLFTKELLEREYFLRRLSWAKIAKKYSVSQSVVSRHAARHGITSRRRKLDLIKRRFGRLVVLSEDSTVDNRSYWKCLCDCGTETVVMGYYLYHGMTTSCGCKKNDAWQGYGEISGTYWRRIYRGAQVRNIIFEVSIEDAWDKFVAQKRRCGLTGIELCFVRNYCKDRLGQTASLDRIDSDLGYSIDNIRWVHKKLNIMKSDMSDTEFIKWCRLVSNHHNN